MGKIRIIQCHIDENFHSNFCRLFLIRLADNREKAAARRNKPPTCQWKAGVLICYNSWLFFRSLHFHDFFHEIYPNSELLWQCSLEQNSLRPEKQYAMKHSREFNEMVDLKSWRCEPGSNTWLTISEDSTKTGIVWSKRKCLFLCDCDCDIVIIVI